MLLYPCICRWKNADNETILFLLERCGLIEIQPSAEHIITNRLQHSEHHPNQFITVARGQQANESTFTEDGELICTIFFCEIFFTVADNYYEHYYDWVDRCSVSNGTGLLCQNTVSSWFHHRITTESARGRVPSRCRFDYCQLCSWVEHHQIDVIHSILDSFSTFFLFRSAALFGIYRP